MRRAPVLAIALATLAQVTPAQAAPPKGAAKFEIKQWSITAGPVVQKPGACNSTSHTEAGYNRWNKKMISLTQRVQYCWGYNKKLKRHVVTQAIFTTKVWTLGWTPWTFDGIVNQTRWGRVGKDFEVGKYIQAKFHFCVVWYCPNAHPFVTHKVFGIGLFYGDGGT
jgi:hypothetical protein